MKLINMMAMFVCLMTCIYLGYVAISEINTEAGIWSFISLLFTIIFFLFGEVETWKERYEEMVRRQLQEREMI